MNYVENDGVLFRGYGRSMPQEIWTGSHWLPYKGEVPKPVEWGYDLNEAEAQKMMDAKAQRAAK